MRELYREADAILNVCGSHESPRRPGSRASASSISKAIPASSRSKSISGNESTLAISQATSRPVHLRRKRRHAPIPRPAPRLEMVAHAPAGRDRFLENDSPPAADAVFTSVANWSTSGLKGYRLARRKISLEQVRGIPAFHRRAAAGGRRIRTGQRHQTARHRARNFVRNGWRLRDPHRLSDRPSHATAITSSNSKGEFTVAKDQYVRLAPAGSAIAARVTSRPAGRSSRRKPASADTTAATAGSSVSAR